MKNRLEFYIEKDPRLIKVNELAKQEYLKAGKLAHNYNHAIWDTETTIKIYENEKSTEVNPTILIASALMHDTGVSIGHYTYHAVNGSKIIRREFPKLGFTDEETEKSALAVEQHNSLIHTFPESQYLYDADTLNKAGIHGIQGYFLVAHEFGSSISKIAQRAINNLPKGVEKGYYTKTAKEMDKSLGNEKYGGLELTLEFWRLFDKILKEGKIEENEAINKAYQILGVGALR